MKSCFAQIAHNFKTFVQPSVVAIYASHHSRSEIPVQVGTGFIIGHNSIPVLVTAKHVLYGNSFKEDPAEKAVFIDGKWVYIGDNNRQLIKPKERDVAITYFKEFGMRENILDSSYLAESPSPKIITIGGFLARDFKRERDSLSPSPLIYTNSATQPSPGMIHLKYPKRRNVDSGTGRPIVSPTPAGLSGGLMIDSLALLGGDVSIVGVFTEMDKGEARGESSIIIRKCIDSL